MLIDFLKENGPTTARDIYLEFREHYVSLSALNDELAELRRAGRVFKSQANPAKYASDEEFCCGRCAESYPKAKRKGHSKYCRECFVEVYQNPVAKEGQAEKPPLTHDEHERSWCHDLSFAWASRPLFRARASA